MSLPRPTLPALALVVLGASPALAAPQVDAQTCLSCHSVDGVAQIDHIPIIHGQSQTYLRNALHAYKSGQRSGGTADVMQAIAQQLSDAEIDRLAEFFGTEASVVSAAPVTHLVKASAEGAEALFDVFSALPGIRTERMLAQLQGGSALPVVIWEKTPSRPPGLPLH